MTLVFQDIQGEISELVNHSIEQIICIDGVDRNTTFTNIFLIWLKLKQKESWYRIFLDANCCFCSVYHSAEFTDNYTEDIANCENCPIYQIDRRFSLSGLTIVSALVYPFNISYGVEFKIVFHNYYCLILRQEEIDSESNLSIIKV